MDTGKLFVIIAAAAVLVAGRGGRSINNEREAECSTPTLTYTRNSAGCELVTTDVEQRDSVVFYIRGSPPASVGLGTSDDSKGQALMLWIGRKNHQYNQPNRRVSLATFKTCGKRNGSHQVTAHAHYEQEEDLLSDTEFRPFWLAWKGATIAAGKGSSVGLNEILNYTLPSAPTVAAIFIAGIRDSEFEAKFDVPPSDGPCTTTATSSAHSTKPSTLSSILSSPERSGPGLGRTPILATTPSSATAPSSAHAHMDTGDLTVSTLSEHPHAYMTEKTDEITDGLHTSPLMTFAGTPLMTSAGTLLMTSDGTLLATSDGTPVMTSAGTNGYTVSSGKKDAVSASGTTAHLTASRPHNDHTPLWSDNSDDIVYVTVGDLNTETTFKTSTQLSIVTGQHAVNTATKTTDLFTSLPFSPSERHTVSMTTHTAEQAIGESSVTTRQTANDFLTTTDLSPVTIARSIPCTAYDMVSLNTLKMASQGHPLTVSEHTMELISTRLSTERSHVTRMATNTDSVSVQGTELTFDSLRQTSVDTVTEFPWTTLDTSADPTLTLISTLTPGAVPTETLDPSSELLTSTGTAPSQSGTIDIRTKPFSTRQTALVDTPLIILDPTTSGASSSVSTSVIGDVSSCQFGNGRSCSTHFTSSSTAEASSTVETFYGRCNCLQRTRRAVNTTEGAMRQRQQQEAAQDITASLTLPTSNLSSTARRKMSAQDSRPSCVTLGWLWVVVCFFPFVFIVLSDARDLMRHLCNTRL